MLPQSGRLRLPPPDVKKSQKNHVFDLDTRTPKKILRFQPFFKNPTKLELLKSPEADLGSRLTSPLRPSLRPSEGARN